ncbi:MAG TPA: hypothetical protein VMN57_08935 [Anaerolineales bacterium]|nr:hypothetical protein [Anaerolineales bacterium]
MGTRNDMKSELLIALPCIIVAGLMAISGCFVSRSSSPSPNEPGTISDKIAEPKSTSLPAISSLASFATTFPLTSDGGVWIDLPSYRSDPLEDIRYLYRMTFNPAYWLLQEGDSIKEPAYLLSSRLYSGCKIFPTVGKGYGPEVIGIRELHDFSGIEFMKTTLIDPAGSSSTVFCGGPNSFLTCYAVIGGHEPIICHDLGLEVIRSIDLIENPRWKH